MTTLRISRLAWFQTIAMISGAALAATVTVAHGETMTVPLPGVSDISIETVGDSFITQGNDERIVVEAEPKVLSALNIKVSGGKLTIASKGEIRTKQPIIYRISIKSLRKLNTEASGEVKVAALKGDNLSLIANGSGDIEFKQLELSQLMSIQKDGSGEVSVKSGQAARGDFHLSGSGDINARSFAVQDLKARLSGSGEMKLNAIKTLKAELSGAGEISYRGNPKVEQSVSGAGSIVRD